MSIATASADKESSPHKVYSGVLQGLYEGFFVPGQRLVEADLARMYQVSRNSVREALSRLAAERVILLSPHRGAQIRLSMTPFVELMAEESPDALVLVQSPTPESRRLALVPGPGQEGDNGHAPLVGLGVVGVCMAGAGALRALPADGEPSEVADLTLMAAQLTGNGGDTQVRTARRWRHFTGDLRDLLELNRMALEALDSESNAGSYDGNHFEGHTWIHPTAVVKSSVIVGPVIIGAEAVISDSYIGPHTSIAERVRIEGAEVERSIVHADASVMHVGGRLVASVVGSRARIFRDFSVPRALRLHVGDGDEVALC